MEHRYDMNRQAQIDRAMCKPGYTWNETLGKCLGMGGGVDKRSEAKERAQKATKPAPTATPPAPPSPE